MQNEDRIFHKVGHGDGPESQDRPEREAERPGRQPLELSPEQRPAAGAGRLDVGQDNPFFARSLVNRYWKHFFGRGLVDPEDDMRVTNPASNPELLDALAKDFVEHGFDLKDLVRTICTSTTYQLAAEPND